MQVNYGLGEKTKGPWMSEYVNFVHGIDRVLIVRETWFGYDCLKIIPQSWFVERDTKTVRDYVYSHYPFIQAEHKGKFETYLRDEINNHIGKLVVLHFTIPDTSAPKHGTGSGTSSDLQTLENKSQNINSMTNIDRIVLLLSLTFHKMGKNIFDSFSMSDLYMIAGMFVIWAGSQFFGVGEVIDAALLAWLWWTIGWDCWRFLVIIINSVKTAIQATSIQQIDDAASQLAPAAAALGIDALMGFILHKFGKGSAVEEAAKKEIKTEEDLVKHDFAQNKIIEKASININEIRPLLKTDPNTAFFWSGRTGGIGGQDIAASIAKSKGGVTLETTIADNGINMPKWDMDNPASIKAWQDVSSAYAEQVSGNVRAVVGQELRPGNIWENIEIPRLMNNPNVNSITTIDPKTGIEKLIYQKGN